MVEPDITQIEADTSDQLEPPPPKRIDPEIEAMKAQLELLKAERPKKEEEAEKQARLEKIWKDAEDAFERRMDAMRKAQEEAVMEIEKARIEAEKAARERREAEKKVEEERVILHVGAMARAEGEFEAEARARAKAAATGRERAEVILEAAREARKAAEKQATEEMESRKRLKTRQVEEIERVIREMEEEDTRREVAQAKGKADAQMTTKLDTSQKKVEAKRDAARVEEATTNEEDGGNGHLTIQAGSHSPSPAP